MLMPPDKLGNKFKTIEITCNNGHEVAQYRKPRSEWGNRTHKLWLIDERIKRLSTQPPLIDDDGELDIPPTDTDILCGKDGCELNIGKIGPVLGKVALILNESNLRPTKG